MRLLLVEDDPAFGPELKNALARQGYAVDLVADGVHAGQMGETEPYDLVVLYLGLPRRGGIELLRFWRTRGIQVPVVIPFGMVAGDSGAPDMRGEAIQELIDHLVALGHRRFLHLAGPGTWVAARNRRQDFDDALAAHGLALEAVIHGDWSAKSGYDAVRAMHPDRMCTAIVAANDQMAFGAQLALRRSGLRVPQDVSLVGFDDLPVSAFMMPPLTTVRQPARDIGRIAVQGMLALIEGRTPDLAAPALQLIVRESTQFPAAAS